MHMAGNHEIPAKETPHFHLMKVSLPVHVCCKCSIHKATSDESPSYRVPIATDKLLVAQNKVDPVVFYSADERIEAFDRCHNFKLQSTLLS
jgi:hypothetical protein